MKKLLVLFIILGKVVLSQPVPSIDEKFTYLTTFSKSADKKYGDDDFVQITFFAIPETNKTPIYIRVYDPNIGGKLDEVKSEFDSKTKFSIYGGKGAHSNKDAQAFDPKGNYKSGVLIDSKTFDGDLEYDGKWYTFGPINPSDGELQPENGGYVLKFVIEGLSGDDGNLYKMFLSKSKDDNVPVEGGNSFCYEYCFRLPETAGFTSHIYPFVSTNVIAVKINVFDYDNEGIIRTVTIAKKGEMKTSHTEGTWSTTELIVVKEEINTSIDVQFIRKKEVKNNNVSVYITNQYNEAIPFYTIPIGGVPKYKYKIDISKAK